MSFRHRGALGWPVVSVAALAAMLVAHSIELRLEDLHFWGDSRAGYLHVGQAAVAGLACLLLAVLAFGALHRTFLLLTGALRASDYAIADLDRIARLKLSNVIARLIPIQIGSLITVELLEQRLSGLQQSSIGAILGSGHITVPIIHLIIGLLASLAVWKFARVVAARSRQVAEALVSYFLPPPSLDGINVGAVRVANVCATRARQPVIALRIANRPPPARVTAIA